ncbi:unnamed protein product, partial [Ixodes hexagonus]
LSQELRPIYNFAHMVNSIEDVSRFLDSGANAFEFDVQFYGNGTIDKVHHGFPCDCLRDCSQSADINDYLDHIRLITDPGEKHGRKHFWLIRAFIRGPPPPPRGLSLTLSFSFSLSLLLSLAVPFSQTMNVVLYIGSVAEQDILRGAITTVRDHDPKLLDRLGFNVAEKGSLEEIRDMYVALNITGHRWHDRGVTNCFSFLFDTDRLKAPIADRKANNGTSIVDKVYFWTTDIKFTMREVLRLGVDGMLSNMPALLIDVLNEDEFKNSVRLANSQDSPWKQIP